MTNKDLTKEEKENVTVDNVEQLPEVQKVKLQLYEISEATLDMLGVSVSIFDLQLENLIFEKMYLLFEKLQPAMKNLEKAEVELSDKRNELLRTLDFKAELNITTKPTKDDKEAVMKPKLEDFNKEISDYSDDVTFYNDKLNVLNDLIKAQRTLLTIEGGLKQ